MKINHIISSILKEKWLIDLRIADSYIPLIHNMLNGLEVDFPRHNPSSFNVVSENKNIHVESFSDAPKNSIALINVNGSLMKYDGLCNYGMLSMGDMVVEADKSENIEAIILKIDSPGGTVDGTKNFADIIKSTTKPVIAYIDGMMCSAALWIGTSADEVIASNSTDEIGSIGVMLSFADYSKMYEDKGVKFHYIFADQSKDKGRNFLNSLEGDYKGIIKEELNPLADEFINAVKENRGNKLKNSAELFTGKTFFANDAKKYGLIDDIAKLNYAIERAYNLAKVKNNNKSNSLNNQLYMSEKLKHLATAINVDGFEKTDEGIHLSLENAETVSAKLAENEQNVARLEELTQAKETAENNLTAANSKIDAKNAEIEELKKAAGSKTAKVQRGSDHLETTEDYESVDTEAQSLWNLRPNKEENI